MYIMAMIKDKHSVFHNLTPNLPIWALRSSLLAFLLPMIIHFQRNELFMAYGLVSLMVLRAGFFADKIVSGSRLFYISPSAYNIIYFVNLWILLFGLFYQGIYFRRDISSSVIWLYLLCKVTFYTFKVHLLSADDWGSNIAFVQWDLIVVGVLFANLTLRDISHTIVLVDFIKGAFWGAVLYYFIYHKESLEYQYSISKYLYHVWEGCGMHMAPFKVSSEGVCSCEREDYECADPDDILDATFDECDSDPCDHCHTPKNKQHEL